MAENARPAPPRGVSGATVSVAEEVVELRQKDGAVTKVAMTSGWTLSYPVQAGVDALRVGQFVASANWPVGEGHGAANELRVFEPGYLPEYGTHTVNAPNTLEGTMMTHGFVFGTGQTRSIGVSLGDDIGPIGGHGLTNLAVLIGPGQVHRIQTVERIGNFRAMEGAAHIMARPRLRMGPEIGIDGKG